MKHIILFFVLIFNILLLSATHNRAGEITYRHISGNLFEFTLTTYTYTPSEANEYRDSLEIEWGDDTKSDIPRIYIDYLPDEIQKNTYVGLHEYPGPGVYVVLMSDPNRNDGIENIGGSVNIVFTLKTILKIDAVLGYNNTPVLLNPPIDKAAVGQRFVYNPSAFDIDGDSLSYRMAVCLGANGEEIPSFSLPQASIELYVNPITGDFVWDAPVAIGEYNVALEVDEWRNGVKISSIIRDMQIEVKQTNNLPPMITPLSDFCLTAGNLLTFNVAASDPDNDKIWLSAYGGPFEFQTERAVFQPVNGSNDSVVGYTPLIGVFSWHTTCNHIRKLPYIALFRAEDNAEDVQLTGYAESEITVVAPAPEHVLASPSSNSVQLSWVFYSCQQAIGFYIYRRNGAFSFNPANCETGIPEAGNYTLIDTLTDITATTYLDDGVDLGLPQGYEYCYRIVAFFADGSLSYVSDEICTELVRGAPVFIETSVLKTSETEGKIQLAWLKPSEFDHGEFPGPYKYVLESNSVLGGAEFFEPKEIFGIDNLQYTDTLINTKIPKSYKLTLYQISGAEIHQVGEPAYTTALFLEYLASDRQIRLIFNDLAPWENYEYTIYRALGDAECEPILPFDSISTVAQRTFTDTGLENGKKYVYKVRSKGQYQLDYIPKPLINRSQELCTVPVDTVPPCKVQLTLNSDCDLFQNNLSWTMHDSCQGDADDYLIYYRPTKSGDFELIAETNDTYYTHSPEHTLAGCYAVVARDSVGNSLPLNMLTVSCIDKCYYYRLPNVFTPNNDGKNELFVPYPYNFVEKIELKIYNRWGNLVFETTDPDINWDGTDFKTGQKLSDGVYYYLCDVYERRLSGLEIRHLNGFVTLITDSKNSQTE